MAERFENGYGGLVAVVTGGGTGMGRELVRQLTAQGCDVAACDVIPENLAATVDHLFSRWQLRADSHSHCRRVN
jgi:NAD(P)-dependent dehydrogenase (short-subunit alcohol dehydrogenase family)